MSQGPRVGVVPPPANTALVASAVTVASAVATATISSARLARQRRGLTAIAESAFLFVSAHIPRIPAVLTTWSSCTCRRRHLIKGAGWMSRCVGASPILGDMTIQRMDNVGIDLDAAVAFFTELGMELEGRMLIEGSWAGNVTGLDDMRSEIAMMRIPGAPGRLELAKYHAPEAITPKPEITPANTLGLHRVMFAVDDIEDTLARLRPHGAELVGDVARYEDSYLLCYLRGPSGIILALAEQLNRKEA